MLDFPSTTCVFNLEESNRVDFFELNTHAIQHFWAKV
jgi:hypothetical protein